MSRHASHPRVLRDKRWRTLALLVIAIAVGGLVIAAVSDDDLFGRRFSIAGSPGRDQAGVAEQTRQEIHLRFQQGVAMLHAKQYEHAITAFHRVLELAPEMPEAHVNMGFTLIGLGRHAAARDFFEGAMALRRDQVNAYYGLAVALDELHDRPGAIGAMRTYVHLSKPDDPHVRKAQAALWEWEAARTERVVPGTPKKP